jgi:hypothetical protein
MKCDVGGRCPTGAAGRRPGRGLLLQMRLWEVCCHRRRVAQTSSRRREVTVVFFPVLIPDLVYY